MSDLKTVLFWWNNTFPLDRLFREKYGIPFNSKKHRNTCQIDILFDLMEDRIFREHYLEKIEIEKRQAEYEKTGKIFIISAEEEDDRFNKFIPINEDRLTILKPKVSNG